MKRLKIFFGTAALVVAVSGAFVTKATTQLAIRYVQETNSCEPIETSKNCLEAPGVCLHEDTGEQLFARPNPSNPNECEGELSEP